jgi:hypothetical protein
MRRDSRKKEVVVKPDETQAEVLASSIVEIARGMHRLINGPLKMDAIILLIHDSMPASQRVSRRQIREVLEAVEQLQARYTNIAKVRAK